MDNKKHVVDRFLLTCRFQPHNIYLLQNKVKVNVYVAWHPVIRTPKCLTLHPVTHQLIQMQSLLIWEAFSYSVKTINSQISNTISSVVLIYTAE